jgi:hypothetical protein
MALFLVLASHVMVRVLPAPSAADVLPERQSAPVLLVYAISMTQ